MAMDPVTFPQAFGLEELTRLRTLVHLVEPPVSGEALARGHHPEVEYVVGGWGMPALTARVLDRLPKLRVLFYAAGSIKGIVTDAFWNRGIRVTSAAAENAKPTAEYATAQIILSLKRTWEGLIRMREERVHRQPRTPIPGCYGTTVGLLSLGQVGRRVARLLAALEVEVIAYDPMIPPETAGALGVRLCSLDDVFAMSDVVSCHLPITTRTVGLLGGEHFRAMKPGATFVNTARGAVVREEEMIAVLGERPDLFAVLDVSWPEPPRPDSPLYDAPNIVLTPHLAGSQGLECRRMGRMMVDEIERHRANQALLGEVAQDQLAHMA